MTKQEFIAKYQENMGVSTKKEAEKLVNGFFSTLEDLLVTGDELSIIGFGKFEVKEKPARNARNPKTGEMIPVAAKKVVKFKVGKGLATKVAGK